MKLTAREFFLENELVCSTLEHVYKAMEAYGKYCSGHTLKDYRKHCSEYQPNRVEVVKVPELATNREAGSDISFLREYLKDGEKDRKDVYNEAKLAKVSPNRLHRARLDLGVTQRRADGTWFWKLP